VGVYDLVERSSGRVLRYRDPNDFNEIPYEVPSEGEDQRLGGPGSTLTTSGSGSPIEYDFIGTGFHVGGGYIVTNRHVLQPWTEDDQVKIMMRGANGRARIKKLVIYFPNLPQPFPLQLKRTSSRDDLAVATINFEDLPADIPVLPLETDPQAATVGKAVVTMGYPNGPDRLLAMVEDEEAKRWNDRFGSSRQNLIHFLAQSKKIVPLTTQGTITDLDARRIVHDAKTAEGGSGAPLFGQTGRVIGVNFGVFTENTAVNLAVPVSYAIELLRSSGWKTPEEMQLEAARENQLAASNGSAKPE
jgi:S1-C subfamily serine protease